MEFEIKETNIMCCWR